MIQYKLRRYTKGDLEFVYQAKKEAYKNYVEKFWGSWDEKKQRTLFSDFIKKVQDSLFMIEYNKTPIGLYHGNLMDKDTYEIGNIIVPFSILIQTKNDEADKALLHRNFPRQGVCLHIFHIIPHIQLGYKSF